MYKSTITIWQERFGKRFVQILFVDDKTLEERVEVVEVPLGLIEDEVIEIAAKQRDNRIAQEAIPVEEPTNWEKVANTLISELTDAGKTVDITKVDTEEKIITGLTTKEPIEVIK